ncbi:ran GTPase-activating protein 1 [Nasonia vitripennis]|uniref:Ran-GTPase activating protein 1 C-terminal domain-containing protein n=1 Tax=Nasonia vitripennis TaxID=7425 RepID=A0A7M7HD47_NASVI|nr:ran GTPase-activating protein 1 [Nasonia vitripennis]
MSSFNFNAIGNSLKEASQKTEGTGVSFAGKSLKLNTEDDAKQVSEAIEKCKNMEYLDLEGNTLGPDAAKGISKAIEKNGSKLKRALWKDMFTGRMKDEIPVALEHLGRGLCAAGTQLVELDLSDNAFGPIGVKGLADLLRSSSCYTLKELRLNNNGLGITGGKMLAKALMDCHNNSMRDTSKPFGLKVFIAGRNRLENEGATALAEVFRTLTSLEEVVMPQNGIYHVGISALANGLSVNQGLRILNLNDNTVGPKGAQALADVLHNFSCLERLNLGDCLLKTRGAVVLADALGINGNHPSLTELNLSFNEIKIRGAGSIADAMADKTQLTTLILDGNAFGEEGRAILVETLKNSDRIESLGTLDEDEDDDEDESEDEDEDESENNETKSEVDEDEENVSVKKQVEKPVSRVITVEEFLKAPTGENFLLMQGDKAQSFIDHIRNLSQPDGEDQTSGVLKVVMKVSALCASGYMDIRQPAEQVTERLYSELFTNAVKNNQIPSLNNALLVCLGLLKGEDKNSSKIDWNLEGCFKALEKVSQRDYFLQQTKETLKVFIDRPMKPSRTRVVDPFQEAKTSLKAALDRTQST